MAEKHPRRRDMAGKPTGILRRSVFLFLKHFHRFTSAPCLLAFPFALSTLLAQTLVPTSTRIFPTVHARLTSLFLAAGFPPSSDLFAVLNFKLAQTLLCFLFVLPFTLTFLLFSKASTIRALSDSPGPVHSFPPLLATQLCNSVIVLAANATCFCLLVLSFDAYGIFVELTYSSRGLLIFSAVGAVAYSIAVANAYVVCNLALVVSGVEGRGGCASVLKACVLTRGRAGTGLTLAVPVNVALAGVEALFQYRVVRGYYGGGLTWWVAAEAAVVVYMYAMLVVLDTVVWCVFLKSCYRDIEIEERSRENAFQSLL